MSPKPAAGTAANGTQTLCYDGAHGEAWVFIKPDRGPSVSLDDREQFTYRRSRASVAAAQRVARAYAETGTIPKDFKAETENR